MKTHFVVLKTIRLIPSDMRLRDVNFFSFATIPKIENRRQRMETPAQFTRSKLPDYYNGE
ncbi:MAG: hypothetical protein WDM76_08810 [Limisphaerales bacterium]